MNPEYIEEVRFELLSLKEQELDGLCFFKISQNSFETEI